MSQLSAIARITLGSIFIVVGANGFLKQWQYPMPPDAWTFRQAITATGYLHELLKGTEVVGGLFLVFGRFTPLTLVVLAPVVLNIFLFHIFLDPAGNWIGFLLLGLHAFLVYVNRAAYASLLRA